MWKMHTIECTFHTDSHFCICFYEVALLKRYLIEEKKKSKMKRMKASLNHNIYIFTKSVSMRERKNLEHGKFHFDVVSWWWLWWGRKAHICATKKKEKSSRTHIFFFIGRNEKSTKSSYFFHTPWWWNMLFLFPSLCCEKMCVTLYHSFGKQ